MDAKALDEAIGRQLAARRTEVEAARALDLATLRTGGNLSGEEPSLPLSSSSSSGPLAAANMELNAGKRAASMNDLARAGDEEKSGKSAQDLRLKLEMYRAKLDESFQLNRQQMQEEKKRQEIYQLQQQLASTSAQQVSSAPQQTHQMVQHERAIQEDKRPQQQQPQLKQPATDRVVVASKSEPFLVARKSESAAARLNDVTIAPKATESSTVTSVPDNTLVPALPAGGGNIAGSRRSRPVDEPVSRQQLATIAHFRNVALRSGSYLQTPRAESHFIDCFEGANLHKQTTGKNAGIWLCSFSGKKCFQRRMDGWGFCNKHVLEDPRAAVTQCQYINKQTNRRCQLPVALVDPVDQATQSGAGFAERSDLAVERGAEDSVHDVRFCGPHRQLLGMAMPRSATVSIHLKKKRQEHERNLSRKGQKASTKGLPDLEYFRTQAEPDWFFNVITSAGLSEEIAARGQAREHYVAEFLRAHHIQSSGPALRALHRIATNGTDRDLAATLDTAEADSSSDDDYEYGSALPFASVAGGNPNARALSQNRHAIRPGSSQGGYTAQPVSRRDQVFLWDLLSMQRSGTDTFKPTMPTPSSDERPESQDMLEMITARRARLEKLRAVYEVQYARLAAALVTTGDDEVPGIREMRHRTHDAPFPVGVYGRDSNMPSEEGNPADSTADFLKWKTSVAFRREQERYTLHRRLHLPLESEQPPVSSTEIASAVLLENQRCKFFDECGRNVVPESSYCFFHLPHAPQNIFERCCGIITPASASEPAELCGYPVSRLSQPRLCLACAEFGREEQRPAESTDATSDASTPADAIVRLLDEHTTEAPNMSREVAVDAAEAALPAIDHAAEQLDAKSPSVTANVTNLPDTESRVRLREEEGENTGESPAKRMRTDATILMHEPIAD